MMNNKFQSNLDAITKLTSKVIPTNRTQEAIKQITTVPNLFKDMSFFSGINNISKKLNLFTDAVAQISKAVNPYFYKSIEVGYRFSKIYAEELRSHFLYKQSILKMWSDFENDLKSKNRYFPKSEFLTIFETCAKEAKCFLYKGSTLYRARTIDASEFPYKVKEIINTATEFFNDFDHQKQLKNCKDLWVYIDNIPSYEWEQFFVDKLKLEDTVFWGFDAEQSGAPKPGQGNVQGRANPVGISYLYAANTLNTAISEIQPTIGQVISIAKIKILRKLNIFDFNFCNSFKNSELMEKSIFEVKEQLGISIWKLQVFFNTISELFSKPALGNADNYYSTQYLSEFIKNMGFDGIRYKSSLKKGGLNIVLFNTQNSEKGSPKNYEIMSSSLHKIENVKMTSKILLPRKDKT